MSAFVDEQQPPSVSVIVPAFNAGTFIERCLGSIVDQSYQPVETLVVDDASTDDTPQIVAAWATERLNLRLISAGENAGPANARNLGIASATGEWIAFLDADDFWRTDHLARLVETVSRFPMADVVFSTVVGQREMRRGPMGLSIEIQRPIYALLRENFVPQSAVMVRRSSLSTGGGYRTGSRYAEDYDLWLRLSAEKHAFAWTGADTCERSEHNEQVSARFPLQMFGSAWSAREEAVLRLPNWPDDAEASTALQSAAKIDLEAAWSFRSKEAIRHVIRVTSWVPDSARLSLPWERRISWQWSFWYAAVWLYDRLPRQVRALRNEAKANVRRLRPSNCFL